MKSSSDPWRFAFIVRSALALRELLRLVLRHPVGQVAIDAARTVVRRVHPRARHRLVDVEEVFALAEA